MPRQKSGIGKQPNRVILGSNRPWFAYYDGDSVKQDYAQAATWYWKAAEQGNEGAQLGLGLLYDNGEGVSQDYGQAAFWYRRAANRVMQGHNSASVCFTTMDTAWRD